MGLSMQSSVAAFERAYDAYTDRLHDAYYADDAPECECGAFMDVTGDQWEGDASCPECDYSYSWSAPEPDDSYEEYDGYVGADA